MTDSKTSTWPGGHEFPGDLPDLDPICLIGEGSYGKVWLAKNRTTGLLRAVKVIPLDRAGREVGSIIRLEGKACGEHPSLLRIHHVGKTARHVFCIMDPADDVSGVPASEAPNYRPATLKERLKAGPLPPETALRCAEQLLAGLAHLHGSGMVHRDVKPGNCLFVAGNLKLADFGLLAEADLLVSQVGTPKYMPPDGRMDERADVYAAGLVIYEMTTGMPVDKFPSLDHHVGEVARNPVLKALNRLALRACERDPRNRFADASVMLAALRSSLRPKRRPGIALLAFSGCLVLVLLAAIWWPRRPPSPVRVNFITVPPEATILVDGELLRQPDGMPYMTPCTAHSLLPGGHRVVLRYPEGYQLDAGTIDFTTTREVFVSGESPPKDEAPGPN